MIAWEWTIEKAREGDEEKSEKKKTRKISQTQVCPPPPVWFLDEEELLGCKEEGVTFSPTPRKNN